MPVQVPAGNLAQVISAQRLLNRALHRIHDLVEWYGAIAPGTDKGDSFGSLGAGSCIAFPPAALMGATSIHIGEDTLVGRGCTLSVGYTIDDDQRPERGLEIGSRCVVGARSTITAHESIRLGDDVWLGQDVFISDASHGYQDPDTPIGQQFGAHHPVSVGSGSWIGHGAVVLPGTTIGRNVVVGAGTVVRGEIPDHCVVVGVPGRVVRRLELGVGWVSTDGTDVRPVLSTAEMDEILGTASAQDGPGSSPNERLQAEPSQVTKARRRASSSALRSA